MIEITAKQLYDIYKNLPDAYQWHCKYNDMPYIAEVSTRINPKKNYDNTVMEFEVHEINFTFDINIYPFEWKPTTDLIIKA